MSMMDARIKVGSEYFYGMSIYLPSTWDFDGNDADILFQWKGGVKFLAKFSYRRRIIYVIL